MTKLPSKIKEPLRLLAFLLAVGLLLALANGVLTPKSDTMAAFYAEPKDSIDVLFVGGSHAAAAFDPIQLWQEQGFTSYTLYSWGQPAWTSYHYVKEALKTQSPQVVVVEGFGFMYGSSYLANEQFNDTSDDFSLLMRPSLNRMELAAAMSRWQTNHQSVLRYASLLRYHGRWKALTADDFTWFAQDHLGTGKGFGPIYTHEAFPGQQVPETSAQPAALYLGCEEYLYKLIELSKKEGFKLVIAATPYIIEAPTEWGVWQAINDICKANGVEFINYNGKAGDEAGFSYESDMAEHAHINLYGALKLTRHLGAVLAQAVPLPDHRTDPAFASWQAAASAEGWDRQKMRLRLSPTAADYLPRLAAEGLTAFIVSCGELGGQGSESLAAGFEALGLGALPEKGTGLVAVVEDGRVAVQQRGPQAAAEYTLGGRAVSLRSGVDGSIEVGGQRLSLPYGNCLAVVVVDSVTGEVVQSVVFRPEEGSITRTD